MALDDDTLHVWRARLDLEGTARDRLFASLSADEQQRASRLHFDRHREHFITARGILRMILSRYLLREPGSINFRYSAHGKPSLAESVKDRALQFNLSHSHGLALFVLSPGGSVGIDVERLRPLRSGLRIAERFFAPTEVLALRALPEEMRDRAFFHCWTRKEAFLKAIGEGISFGLHRVEVPVGPNEKNTVIVRLVAQGQTTAWSVRDLDAGPGFVAAVAEEGSGHPVTLWDWQP
jgi:4'-phosphopantetheinyl transferase